MATISIQTIQRLNVEFQEPSLFNTGLSIYNIVRGRNNNIPQGFQGIVIGDAKIPTEDGIYIGDTLSITAAGVRSGVTVIDGGVDTAFTISRTNPIDVIDGSIVEQLVNLPLPVDPIRNWGRPIIHGFTA